MVVEEAKIQIALNNFFKEKRTEYDLGQFLLQKIEYRPECMVDILEKMIEMKQVEFIENNYYQLTKN